MKLLRRYILCQFLTYLGEAFVIFLCLLVMGNLIRGADQGLAGGKISLGQMACFLGLLIPYLIPYVLPFSFVIATLLTLKNLLGSREYIALNSAGISPLRIVSPILGMAIIGVLISLCFNLEWAPNAVTRTKEFIYTAVQSNPAKFLTPRTCIRNFPGYIIYIDAVEDNNLHGFQIWKHNDAGEFSAFIQSKTGHLNYNRKTFSLELTLKDGTIETKIDALKNFSIITFDQFEMNFSISEFFKQNSLKKKMRYMNLKELLELHQQAIVENDFQSEISAQSQIQLNIVMAMSVFVLVLFTISCLIQTRGGTFLHLAIILSITVLFYVIEATLPSLNKRPEYRPDLLCWIPLIALWGVAIYKFPSRRKMS